MPDRTQDLTNHRKVATACKNYIDKKINDLKWELGSHTLDVETDTDVAYVKTVPTGTIGCTLDKVGGMSYKSSNLLNEDVVKIDTWNIKLGTANLQANVTYNLWSEVSFPAGERATLKDNNGNIIAFSGWTYSGNNYFILDTAYDGLLWLSGTFTTVEPKKFMLNSGTTALPYQAYNTGSIRDSAVTSVISKDSNNTTLDTYTIPAEVQALEGYGWGVNSSVYNYIDFETKKFVKKVGRVDLETLDWVYTSSRFRATITNYNYISASNTPNALMPMYTAYPYQTDLSLYSKSYTISSAGLIVLNDTSYTDAETFKTAMSGVYLYYELATPVETDISQYIDNGSIVIEADGTLTFTNTYEQAVPSEVDYLIEEVKA